MTRYRIPISIWLAFKAVAIGHIYADILVTFMVLQLFHL